MLSRNFVLALVFLTLLACGGSSAGPTGAGTLIGALFVFEEGASGAGKVHSLQIRGNGSIIENTLLGFPGTQSIGTFPTDMAYDFVYKNLYTSSDDGRIDAISVGSVGDLTSAATTTLSLPNPSGRQHRIHSLEVYRQATMPYLFAGTSYYKSFPITDAGDLYSISLPTAATFGTVQSAGPAPIYHSGLDSHGNRLIALSEGNSGIFGGTISSSGTVTPWSSVIGPPHMQDLQVVVSRGAVYGISTDASNITIGAFKLSNLSAIGPGSYSTGLTGKGEIAADPSGNFIYAIGQNSTNLVVYDVNPNGTIVQTHNVNLGYKPHSIATVKGLYYQVIVSDRVGQRINVYGPANGFTSPTWVVQLGFEPTEMMAVQLP